MKSPCTHEPYVKVVVFQGIKVYIDRLKGTILKGSHKGKSWRYEQAYDYGFIDGTNGGDDEGIDVCIGPNAEAGMSYWVEQLDEDTDQFDEFKVLLGWDDVKAALHDWKCLPGYKVGEVHAMDMQLLRALCDRRPNPIETVAQELEAAGMSKQANDLRQHVGKPVAHGQQLAKLQRKATIYNVELKKIDSSDTAITFQLISGPRDRRAFLASLKSNWPTVKTKGDMVRVLV